MIQVVNSSSARFRFEGGEDMWQCVKCGEKVEDNFTECWNCRADRDGVLPEEGDLSAHENIAAENRVLAPEKPGSINCLRCNSTLAYNGTMQFKHSPLWWTGELRFMAEHLEMYVCLRCGHVEFLVPNSLG
jgi:ribosomal protein S27AE